MVLVGSLIYIPVQSICVALHKGDHKAVSRMLEKEKINIEQKSSDGRTALIRNAT